MAATTTRNRIFDFGNITRQIDDRAVNVLRGVHQCLRYLCASPALVVVRSAAVSGPALSAGIKRDTGRATGGLEPMCSSLGWPRRRWLSSPAG